MSDIDIEAMRGKRALPPSSLDQEIHPGDWVVIVERDPYLVGDHPLIQSAARDGLAGRVIAKRWLLLGAREQQVIGKAASYECCVEFSDDQPRKFYFWQDFVRKVEPPTLVRPT